MGAVFYLSVPVALIGDLWKKVLCRVNERTSDEVLVPSDSDGCEG
jgi:hypothetical protein